MKEYEKKNKKLMLNMWMLNISTCLFYIGIVTLAVLTLEDGQVLETIICICFYGFKLKVEAGYYFMKALPSHI